MPIDAHDVLDLALAAYRSDHPPRRSAARRLGVKFVTRCDKCPTADHVRPVLRRSLPPEGRQAEWRVAWLCQECA
jgi:hypothetical protein